ncbi:cell wall elongation regulator TseB-like domain-containing protein [Metabacillus halosaccharovorans]|uniref:DUF5590 domain-containing protein n=1 Tax=Metabacillus halosaccharovorans TaxID=930124 RepID=A0ABT3DMW3_9BACI|nr:DUF5590 domain-containing protein [Metabacillus halosaccharovorans]MCV9888382.1 DUF5590 domain-containing protein [Metabacillus halosaccharovorans]
MEKKIVIPLFILGVLIISGIWILTSSYLTARGQYEDGYEQSKQFAMEEANLKNISKINTFNSDQKYHVITAKNNENEQVYGWISNIKKERKMIVKKKTAGITKNEALESVNEEHNPSEIISVQLGMDEGIPIWEVKYQDESDRYTFDYVNFYDGKIIKHMALKKS